MEIHQLGHGGDAVNSDGDYEPPYTIPLCFFCANGLSAAEARCARVLLKALTMESAWQGRL